MFAPDNTKGRAGYCVDCAILAQFGRERTFDVSTPGRVLGPRVRRVFASAAKFALGFGPTFHDEPKRALKAKTRTLGPASGDASSLK